MGYDQQIEALKAAAEATNQETPEQKKKRERRERSQKTIAAIVEGTQALANLFFTTQYAPNAYNPQNSQLGKVNERIEAMKAERQADADRYNNFMLRLGDAQNAKAKTLREMQAQHEAQKLAREKAQREAELHPLAIAIKEAQGRKENNQADKAGYEAISAQAEADNAPALQEAKLQTEQARRGSYQAAAANSMASARAHDRSNVGEFIAYDEKGNPHPFKSAKAAEYFARRHGTWQEQDETETTTTEGEDDTNGKSSKTTTKTKKGGYPARPKQDDDTPPSRRGNNDNTPPSRRN